MYSGKLVSWSFVWESGSVGQFVSDKGTSWSVDQSTRAVFIYSSSSSVAFVLAEICPAHNVRKWSSILSRMQSAHYTCRTQPRYNIQYHGFASKIHCLLIIDSISNPPVSVYATGPYLASTWHFPGFDHHCRLATFLLFLSACSPVHL